MNRLCIDTDSNNHISQLRNNGNSDKEKTSLTSGVFFLKSRLCSTNLFLDMSLSSWRAASSVAVISSSFCKNKKVKVNFPLAYLFSSWMGVQKDPTCKSVPVRE